MAISTAPGPLRTATAKPVRKVSAGALSGALVTVAVYVLNTYVLAPPQRIDGTVAAALTVLVTLLIAYLVPPSADDSPVPAAGS
jgi:hypothetical protein